MEAKVLLAAVVCMLCADIVYSQTDQVVCYYTNWAVYRPVPGRFRTADVDPSKCTIINYAFVGLASNGSLISLDPWGDFNLRQIRNVTALKQKNSALKVLVSMGGWNEGSKIFSTVAANPRLRTMLVNSAVKFIKDHGFDGLDICWTYPTQRGGVAADRENFNVLLRELKAGLTAANSGYMLTAAVLGSPLANINRTYDVPNISATLDFLHLMLYDFHTPDNTHFTYQAASVKASTINNENNSQLNRQLSVTIGVESWVALGAHPNKITLGIPFYGHSWTLADRNNNGLWAPTNGVGNQGKLTKSPGLLSYQEICLNTSRWTVVRDPEVVSPFQFFADQWISFDDPISVVAKVDLAKEWSLAGVMIWDLDFDDFNDSCGGGRYPLLTAIFNEISLINPQNRK